MDLLSGDSGQSEAESKLDKHKSRVQLFDILSDSTPFSLEELKRLVRYELGIEPETFTSNNANKLTFADNLIGYCRRNGYLTALLSAMRQAKPNEPRIEALSLEVGLPEKPPSTGSAGKGAAPILAGMGSGPTSPTNPGATGGENGSGSVWLSPTVIAAIIGLIGTLGAVFLAFWLNRDSSVDPSPTEIAAGPTITPTLTEAPPYPAPASETPLPTDTLTPVPPTETATRTASPTHTPTPVPPTDTPTLTATPVPPTETPIPNPPTQTPTSSPTVNPVVTHRVQPGEYLSCISENYYGTNTVSIILCGFNQERGVIGDGADNPDIDPCSRIRSGQILHIPYPPTRVVPQITLPPHTPNACPAVPTNTITATLGVTPSLTVTPTVVPSDTPAPTATATPSPPPTPTETSSPSPIPTTTEETESEEPTSTVEPTETAEP